MKIQNVKIKNVTIGINDREKLAVTMSFEGSGGGCAWSFIMDNPTDVQRLILLMKYTEVKEVMKLEGKVIRVIVCEAFIRGFGHPIEDKFVSVILSEVMEITQAEFAEFLQ